MDIVGGGGRMNSDVWWPLSGEFRVLRSGCTIEVEDGRYQEPVMSQRSLLANLFGSRVLNVIKVRHSVKNNTEHR